MLEARSRSRVSWNSSENGSTKARVTLEGWYLVKASTTQLADPM